MADKILFAFFSRVLTNLSLTNPGGGLFKNDIGDEGAMALASALRVNGVLKTLWLGRNNIGDEGAVAIADALRVNGVLTNLSLTNPGGGLFGPNIGDEGAMALASALRVNGVLKIGDSRAAAM